MLDTHTEESRQKRLKKKNRERKAKTLLKMRMGMDTPTEIGIDASEMNLMGDDSAMGGEGSLFSLDQRKVFFLIQDYTKY